MPVAWFIVLAIEEKRLILRKILYKKLNQEVLVISRMLVGKKGRGLRCQGRLLGVSLGQLGRCQGHALNEGTQKEKICWWKMISSVLKCCMSGALSHPSNNIHQNFVF